MSQENVEVVQRFYEVGQRALASYWKNPRSGTAAFEAGDLDPETEQVLAMLHPDVEINPRATPLLGGTGRGHLGWLTFWEELLEASEDYRVFLREIEDLGPVGVLAEVEGDAKWKGSGMQQSATAFYLFTLRDGLIVRIDSYRDRKEALEAVGLSEQDAHADS